MKIQYTVTVSSGVPKETLNTIMTSLAVEFNWIVQDISEMFGENIVLQWEETE
jgi:hypothetical protein